MTPTTVVSSANLMKRLELCDGVQSWVSRVKRRGLSTHPWGAPVFSVMVLDVLMPTRTAWGLPVRKWHNWLNGVVQTICPSMWVRQRRLWWTSGGTLLNTPPLTIDSSTVERVSSTKFLGVNITEDLTWTTNTTSFSKKAQQRPHFLRRLKRTSLPPLILTTFYRGTIESVLTSCITVWYGNCSAADRKTLQRTVNTAAKIIGAPLPSILDIFLAQCSSKATSITKDSLPQSLPALAIRKTVPEHQSPLRQAAQQLFPPGCESPQFQSPHPPLKPHPQP